MLLKSSSDIVRGFMFKVRGGMHVTFINMQYQSRGKSGFKAILTDKKSDIRIFRDENPDFVFFVLC